MELSNADMARVLTQALPYIQKYDGKTVVIKYGGNAMIDEELKSAVMCDAVLLAAVGVRVVLVHGGGPEITATLQRMGKESRFVGGLRYTDRETAEVAQMVLAGKLSKDLVAAIGRHGGRAVGLCGMDGGLFEARKKQSDTDLGFVGEIAAVNTAVVEDALHSGYIPVIATVGTDREGNVYNINADTAAAALAGSLGAENLILMTDVRGLLKNPGDESTLIADVGIASLPALIEQGIVSGGMIPKCECCATAVREGVGHTVIIDGRIPHSILIELFSDKGIGTLFH
ncbi:MAG: acetylglutamate kinase [Clostridiales bacterium]|uniref:acetylglutamate kinase n=1 Tax=Provencibacterium massiliense TaxID=1841868 RepID=UPI0009A6E232|nr:acetylglutamate kinase [Provencibacterium massiliense]PWM39519.1 MAG: acetylglutamate kinase [Clostridiales bacterium]RGB68903.1 acetylglutamate kinase [Harryflintia acetispora]